jgi:hypothetical protein
MTVVEIRKLFPIALRLARHNAGLSIEQAARKAHIDKLTLLNHESGINFPQGEHFLSELDAYGIDFMAFHELLLQARITGRLETLEEEVKTLKRSLAKGANV